MIKPLKFNDDHYVYREQELATSIYFCFKGYAAFVYENSVKDQIVYCTIQKGDFLEMIDFVPSLKEINSGVIEDPR